MLKRIQYCINYQPTMNPTPIETTCKICKVTDWGSNLCTCDKCLYKWCFDCVEECEPEASKKSRKDENSIGYQIICKKCLLKS